MKSPEQQEREQSVPEALNTMGEVFEPNATKDDPGLFKPLAEGHELGLKLREFVPAMLRYVFELLTRGLIAPIEVVLRRNIGERYFAVETFVAFALAMLLLQFPLQIPVWEHFALPLLITLGAGVLFHRIIAFVRDRSDGYWHSRHEGDSRLFLPSMETLRRKYRFTFQLDKLVVEPLFVLIVGLVLMNVLQDSVALWTTLGPVEVVPWAGYCFVAAAAMHLYQILRWADTRRKILDKKDSELESKVMEDIDKIPEAENRSNVRGVAMLPNATDIKWDSNRKPAKKGKKSNKSSKGSDPEKAKSESTVVTETAVAAAVVKTTPTETTEPAKQPEKRNDGWER